MKPDIQAKSLIFFAIGLIFLPQLLFSQKVGFINSEVIRSKFIEAQQSEQRIQSFVEEWKRELDAMQKNIEALELEIQKNRLVWSDNERIDKEEELKRKTQERLNYAKSKFEQSGEYDRLVKNIMQPVEEKIYASVQEVASEEGYDIILDQSVQAIPYTNFKYDLTIKVLRKLGVNADELEKDLKDKIDKDPRNKKKESFEPRKSVRRTRKPSSSSTPEEREIERENLDDQESMPVDSTNTPQRKLPQEPPR